VLVVPSSKGSAVEPALVNNTEIRALYDDGDIQPLASDEVDVIRFRRLPFLRHSWVGLPVIRVCHDSGVRRSRAEQAVRFWQRLGYPLDQIRWDTGSEICRSGGMYGEVTVMMARGGVDMGDNMGITKTYFHTESGEILKAQIFVLGGYANRDRLLEHEIGHALGWVHYNRRLHLMNSHYPDGGHDTTGLSWREYQAEVARLWQ